jgi:hypothetical protein
VSEPHGRDDEDAWLLAQERGEAGPAIPGATAARYARIGALITELPDAPPDLPARTAWTQRVLEVIDAERPTGNTAAATTRRRRWPVAMAAAALLIAGILVMTARWSGREDVNVTGALLVRVTVEPQGGKHRGSGTEHGTSAAVGDRLLISGVAPQAAELRVYDGDGVEQARCASPSPTCSVENTGARTALRLIMVPRVRGQLQPVLFSPPGPATSESYDSDVAAAEAKGIQVIRHAPIQIH